MKTENLKVNRATAATIVAIVLISVLMALPLAAVTADDSPTITTDKTKYSLGETIVISGSGFTPDDTVNIEVQLPGNNGVDTLPPVSTDDAGAFQTTYYPPMIPGRYKITATDGIDTAKTAVTEADALGYQLVSFGVASNDGVTIDDIGWARGNSDKVWHEGAWVPVKLYITGVPETFSASSLEDVYVGFDFTGGTTGGHDARFVDLIRDIQIGTTDLNDTQGWVAPGGGAYNTGSPTALPTIEQVITAQDSPGENVWTGYFLARYLTTTDPLDPWTEVNIPEGDHESELGDVPGTLTDGKHQFRIRAETICDALDGNAPGGTIIIYFQAHLARTFVWGGAGEEGYNATPTDGWGGWLYGDPLYDNDTVTPMPGSGYVTGSSGHMYLLMEKLGAVTCQLPVPPEPEGEIRGYKWWDLNANGVWDAGEPPIENWTIRIISTGGIYTFTDTTETLADGSYSFPGLTSGEWLIQENKDRNDSSTGWIETYPLLSPQPSHVVPGANATSADTTNYTEDADVGWVVELTRTDSVVNEQEEVNFGNFLGFPNTTINITTSTDIVYAGETVTLTVTEENTGDVPLTNVSVTVTNGTSVIAVLNVADVTWGDGGGNGDAILDPDEAWNWTIPAVQVNADTTFTATGNGTDPLGNYITYPDYEEERDNVTVNTIAPNTMVNISASAYLVYAGETVDLYITEYNNGDDPLTNVHVNLTYGTSTSTLDKTTATENITNDNILEVGETWSWTVSDVIVTSATTFNATGYGIDSLGNPVTYPDYEGEQDNVTVYTIAPNTEVNISASAYLVVAGTNVTLYITEYNNGDDPLTNVSVTVAAGASVIAVLDETDSTWGYTINSDDVLDIGETWNWTIYNVTVDDETTFTATGNGTDSAGNPVTYPDYEDEQDEVTVYTLSTNVSISTSAEVVVAGETVDLEVCEENDGDLNLSDVVVIVNNGSADIATLDWTDPTWDDGPGNDDEVLNPGEIWCWEIAGVTVDDEITFNATGNGTYDGIEVTYTNDPDEQDEVTVYTLSTNVSISTSADVVVAGESVNLTVCETNDGDLNLSDIVVVVDNGSGVIATLDTDYSTWDYGSGNDDEILNPGETWCWNITGITVDDETTFTATGNGTYDGIEVTYTNDPDEQKNVTVSTLSTNVSIDADVYETLPGGNVRLTVCETNDGDLNLSDVVVVVSNDSEVIATLDENNIAFGDDNSNDRLDVGETWCWNDTTVPELKVAIDVDTNFTARGNGTADGVVVDWTNDDDEEDMVLVEVGNATRTWGFWKTHLYLVEWMLNDSVNGLGLGILPIDLGTWAVGDTNVSDNCSYMGLMWADQSKNSDGAMREQIDAARIHTAHQALAAIMNSYMPGGAPLPVTLESIADTLTNGNTKQIGDLGSELAGYNEAGERFALDPSLPPTGKVSGNIADPQGARLIGGPCEAFWDTEGTKTKGKGKNK